MVDFSNFPESEVISPMMIYTVGDGCMDGLDNTIHEQYVSDALKQSDIPVLGSTYSYKKQLELVQSHLRTMLGLIGIII